MSAVLSMVGATGIVVFVILWALEYRRRVRLSADNVRVAAQLAASEDQRKRLAKEVAANATEFRELEDLLSKCADPELVRARIRRLLQAGSSADDAGTG